LLARLLATQGGLHTSIEWRSVEGDFARLPIVAAELLGLKVNILVASGTPAALALQKLTTETPIVMVAGIDPVQARLVASLARPGANITGLTRIGPELAGKRLELLKTSSGCRARPRGAYGPQGSTCPPRACPTRHRLARLSGHLTTSRPGLFERWVTPLDAELNLLQSASLN